MFLFFKCFKSIIFMISQYMIFQTQGSHLLSLSRFVVCPDLWLHLFTDIVFCFGRGEYFDDMVGRATFSDNCYIVIYRPISLHLKLMQKVWTASFFNGILNFVAFWLFCFLSLWYFDGIPVDRVFQGHVWNSRNQYLVQSSFSISCLSDALHSLVTLRQFHCSCAQGFLESWLAWFFVEISLVGFSFHGNC